MASKRKIHIEKRESLCVQCRALDIAAIHNDPEDIPAFGKKLVDLDERYRETDCELCQFLLNSAPRYELNPHLQLRVFDRLSQPANADKALLNGFESRRFFTVTKTIALDRYDYSTQDKFTEGGLMAYVPNSAACDDLPLGKVSSERVDFGLLQNFMSQCRGTRHTACEKVYERQGFENIYLLDCIKMEIVYESVDVEYLALSYVWGPSPGGPNKPAPNLNWPQGVFSFDAAPLTIQDAITVTSALGHRYLWIDRYCINQENKAEQKSMLSNMDIIYGRAHTTIVAASGDRDSAGLPGVSRIHRTQQPQFEFAEGRLVTTFPPISTSLNASTWLTRGWTYQEGRLSRRCLVFTESQVYFICQEGCRSEAVASDPPTNWISYLLNNHRLDGKLLGHSESVAHSSHKDRLAYSQRQFTNEKDMLDAFRGILRRSGFVTYWGVPLTTSNSDMDVNTAFALGLLWVTSSDELSRASSKSKNDQAYTRRSDFPTWSWTSVRGEISNDSFDNQSGFGVFSDSCTEVPNIQCNDIKFSIRVKGVDQDLAQALRETETNFMSEESQGLTVSGDLVKVVRKDILGGFYYRFSGMSKYNNIRLAAHLDLDEDFAPSRRGKSKNDAEDALILVNWKDPRRIGQQRIVLMLLRWIKEGRAERKGLLSEFRTEYNEDVASHLKISRKTFTLQ